VTLAKHYGATVIATASAGKHDAVRALGADHVLDSRDDGLAAAVRQLTDGAGADLVLESAGGATFGWSLAAARRVTGRVVLYGAAGGDAAVTNRQLLYEHQVHLIGLNIGVLIQAAPQIFGELMGELSALIARGILPPGAPTVYDLADGPRALVELERRASPAGSGCCRPAWAALRTAPIARRNRSRRVRWRGWGRSRTDGSLQLPRIRRRRWWRASPCGWR
jgi:NADPH:quinone reductase